MRRSRQSSPVVSTLDVPPESPRDENENESENDQLDNEKTPRIRKRQEVPSPVRAAADEATEPAEMTALKMELTTLSTSHASIQSTLHLLQAQLLELKRVNNELQEENESYNILLRERTLSGQFDILRATGGRNSDDEEDDEDEEGAVGAAEGTPAQRTFGDERPGRAMSVRSKSTLDVVPEHEEIVGSTSPAVPTTGLGLRDESPSSKQSKRARRAGARSGSPQLRGESLGDLPITGPGLDLAAELGRAESKDILEGRLDPAKAITQQQQAVAPKPEQTEEMQCKSSRPSSPSDKSFANVRIFLLFSFSLFSSSVGGQVAQRREQGALAVCIQDHRPHHLPRRVRARTRRRLRVSQDQRKLAQDHSSTEEGLSPVLDGHVTTSAKGPTEVIVLLVGTVG